MPDLSSIVLPELERHRLPGLNAGDGQILPHYHGYSIANLPASVIRWLGLPPPQGQVPLAEPLLETLPDSFQHVIVLLVDGMGYDPFTAFLGASPWNRLLPDAVFAPLTSVVPSTTASALTTLWTGALPAEHGVIGYELFLKEFGVVANMILHSPAAFTGDTGSLRRAGFDPLTFLTTPTLGAYLAEHGVKSFAFQPAAISHSGLSQMLLTGAETQPYRTLADLAVSLRSLLFTLRRQKAYIYVYWPDIDTLSHRFGPADERIRLEFEQFSFGLGRLVERLQADSRGETLLVVLADHGLIATPRNPAFELRNHPQLVENLAMLPSGENRLPYLFVRPGKQTAVEDYIERTWPGRFPLISGEQALAAGLLGDGRVNEKLLDRLGDCLAIPQGDAYWWWSSRDNTMLGRHGGLSRAEMLVPFFALAL